MRKGWILLSLWLALPVAAQTSVPLLPADEIIRRFLDRCQTTTNRLAAQCHACVRRTVIEELGGDGVVKERKTREHAVELRGESPAVKLLKLDGRAPTDREAKREATKEAELKQRYAERKDKARERGPDFVDEKLVRRFAYVNEGTETVGGRPAHILRFQAGPNAPAKDASERALNLLAGRIWIDAEEFELVKVEARLKEPLTVLGGIVASIQRLDFSIERRRQPDGFWFNTVLGTYAEGRKLFSTFRIRSRIEQDEFRVLPAAQP